MKIFGRLVALLGLSFVAFVSPGDERFSFARSPQTRNPAPPSRRVVTSTGLSPLSTLVGGDTCSSPTPIVLTAGSFNDTGTTIGKADNSTNELRFACGIVGSGPDRPGPDVFYSFTIVGSGNSLTFSLTTTSPLYDPAIYVHSVCGDLDSCVSGADVNFEGEPETLTVSGLTPGTYYFAVDSAFSSADPNNASGNYALNVTGTFGDPSAGFYTLTPCRVADTRGPAGTYGAPSLQAGGIRTFPLVGQCGIPETASAVALNLTVTGPTALGHLTVFPQGSPLPNASTLNYRAGQTRANNAIVPLGTGGAIAVACGQSSGTTNFIIDVNGYFTLPSGQ